MTKELSKGRMILYSLADIAKGLFTGMIANYLLYFFQPTVNSGIPNLLPQNKILGFITIMALITALGKLIDAFSDPVVAYLSDKSDNKRGRRIPFMQWSFLIYGLSVLLIFLAPFKAESALNAIWVLFFTVLYYVGYTFYFIPRNALIPEVITDSKKRVTFYAISTAFFMGSSSLMYTATLFVDLFKKTGMSAISAWRLIFLIFTIIGIICLLISAFSIKEKDYVKEINKPHESVLKSFKTALSNKNFLIFSIATLLCNVSMSFFQASMMYYITELMNIKENMAFVVMLTAIGAALLLFPLIVNLSKKFGKKIMLLIASIVFTIVYVLRFFGNDISTLFVGKELVLGIMIALLVAFPFASINILPQAVFSDIIQEDSVVNKVNREGIFSAVRSFIEKIAISLAMMMVSSILAIGALPGSNVGILGVRLTGAIAGVISLGSIIFIIFYNEKKVLKNISVGEENE